MDLQSLAAIIGILSGLVTLVGGVAGAVSRMRAPALAQAPRVPVQAGAYPYAPPASNVSGPYPQPGGTAPPAGYRLPASPQPGAAQPGYPQTPPPGYGAPPGQWGNVPQPGTPYTLYPVPQQRPYAPQSWIRRWVHYPWIAIGSAVYLILGGIYSAATGGSSSTTTTTATTTDPVATFLSILVFVAYVATVVYACRQAIRLQRWGWLISILLIVVYGPVAFGIFGPTTPPQPKSPSYPSYPQYPPRRM